MLGYATMLSMTEGLDPRQHEYVGKILGGIEQMSELINDLLDLGRLEAGVDLVRSRFRLRELLESVVEEHQQPARSNGLELTISVPSRLPLAYGDSSLIRQAVANLVNNAIKYAPDSGQVVLAPQSAVQPWSLASRIPGLAFQKRTGFDYSKNSTGYILRKRQT